MHGKCTIHIHMYTNIGNPKKAPRKKSHRINYFLNEKNRTVQLYNCFAIFSWICFKFTAEEKMPWFDAKKKNVSIICFKVCAIWSFYLSNCHVILITSANSCNVSIFSLQMEIDEKNSDKNWLKPLMSERKTLLSSVKPLNSVYNVLS